MTKDPYTCPICGRLDITTRIRLKHIRPGVFVKDFSCATCFDRLVEEAREYCS